MAHSTFRTTTLRTDSGLPLRRFTWGIVTNDGRHYVGGYYTLDGYLFYRLVNGHFARVAIPDYLAAKTFCKNHLFRSLHGAMNSERGRQS